MNQKAVIFDLDGTLAIIDHRRHLVEKRKAYEKDQSWFVGTEDEFYQKWKPNWDLFYEECDKDLPNTPVIELLKRFAVDHQVYIYSGRSGAVFSKTWDWLIAQGIPEGVQLRMRPVKDYTPDEQLKFSWLKQDFKSPLEDVFMVFDDRQKVVDMWRRNGLTCLQVAPGDF